MTDTAITRSRNWLKTLANRRSPFRRRQDVTAIDVDQRMLRVVQVVTGKIPGSIRIKRVEVIPVPENDFDLENPNKVGEWIGAQLKAMHLAPGTVVMAARRGEAVLKELLLPPLKDAGEMASMVNMRVARELPFPESDAVIDFTVTKVPTKKQLQAAKKENPATGSSADKAHVVVAAVRKDTVNRYRTIAKSAGLTLTGLGLRPLASFRTLKSSMEKTNNEAIALVSVRRHEVDVDVLIEGRLVFSRELSVNLNLNDNCAETDKQESIQHAAKEIIRCLHSHEGSMAFKPIERLYIAGGTGLEDDLRDIIQNKIEPECNIMPPPTAIPLPRGKETNAARALTSLGLAIGFVDDGGLALNFLDPKRPIIRRNQGRTKWLLSIVALQALFVFMFGVRSKMASEFENKLTGANGLTFTHSNLAKREKDLWRWTRRKADSIRDWHGTNRRWLEHMAFLSSVIPQCDQIYLLKLNMRSGKTGLITFQVQVKDSQVLHSLEKKLRDLGYLVNPVSFTPANDKFGYKFRATFELTLPNRFPVNLLHHQKTNSLPERLQDDVYSDGISSISEQKGRYHV